MAEATKIEWANHTWSPWEGCQKVGPGCDHCYAEARNQRFTGGANWGPGAPRRRTADWKKPLSYDRAAARDGVRRRIFPSLCDPFDNEVPPGWRAELFALIDQTPHLDWLLLTKRIGNVAKMIEAPGMQKCGLPANVWLGTTVVNQAEADRDIPKLLAVPARVRFLSVEPMLGPIDFRFPTKTWAPGRCDHCCNGDRCDDRSHFERRHCPHCRGTGRQKVVDWVITGGESGPRARPANPQWFRDIRDQCAAAGVPHLHKQNGEWASCSEVECPAGMPSVHHTFDDGRTVRRVGKKAAGRTLDGIRHDGYPT